MEGLELLKEGDEVAVVSFGIPKIRKIARITKTLIILDEVNKYSRETGREVPRSKWNEHIEVATPELKERAERAELIEAIKYGLDERKLNKTDIASLREIVALLKSKGVL